MKKIISALLITAMLIFCAVPSFAAKSVSFTVSDGETFAGDEFTVDVFVSDNSQLKSATLLINYDERALQLLDVNFGAIVPSGGNVINYKNVLSSSGNSVIEIEYRDAKASLSSAGKLLTLTFAANDDAIGKTDLKLTVKGGKVSTASGTVAPTLKNGKINIINNVVVTQTSTSAAISETESQSSEAAVSSEPSSSSSVTQGTTENKKPQPSNSENDNSPSEEKKNNKYQIIIAVALILVVVVMIISLDSNKTVKKKKRRKKKRKTRR